MNRHRIVDRLRVAAGHGHGDRHVGGAAQAEHALVAGAQAVGAALKKNFPAAMDFVDSAARAGERGDGVSSYLGRGCPPADERWMQAQRGTRDEASQRAADLAARSRGRFVGAFPTCGTPTPRPGASLRLWSFQLPAW